MLQDDKISPHTSFEMTSFLFLPNTGNDNTNHKLKFKDHSDNYTVPVNFLTQDIFK
ncbi:MAG: hypothetical protein JWR38_864 [Mucilaginibacter sp.]|nr:hypothetical protein [Mucilaginibacter sp.]